MTVHLLLSVGLLVAIVAPAPTSSKVPAMRTLASMPHSAEAPADEYFGPQHVSAIGMRMRIDVLGRRYTARTESDDDLLHDASDVESAMKTWLGRYPRDTWGAPTSFHLAQVYQDVQTPAARAKARETFAYVASRYPTSKYGHLARLRLMQGFPALHDESPVVSSPAPSAPAPSAPASGADMTSPAPSLAASSPPA